MNFFNFINQNKKLYVCILVSFLMFSVIGGFHTSEMKVSSQQKTLRLIPSGQAVGMKLKTKGVMVVGVEPKGNLPAKKSGVKNGDIIVKVNEVSVLNTRHFEEILKTIGGETVTLTVLRGETEKSLSLTPVLNKSNQYVCGMWLRDSAAGIGTVTFFTEDGQQFAALGHPINDMDTDKTYPVRDGQLEFVEVKGAKLGEKNCPGELVGVLSGIPIGTISSNDNKGLFGTVTNPDFIKNQAVPVCQKQEIQPGKATILSTVSQEGTREYEIEIVRILDAYDNKDFILKVTDEELLKKTGGIVQGMSGSPVLQNGKIVGAVTHVFVNDPTRGYGIFIENMLSEAEKIK
ncbi:MAG: SpoIVB peptidase [Clostridia bacterium]|nr:SpoIVB peptidase [Clostridia bacterium]